jgi:L-amino acid N-acyltransferase YncA
VLIRRASLADADAIAGIYAAGVAEGGATFQTTAPKAAAFEHRIRTGELFLVAEDGGTVVGAGWVSDYDSIHDYYAGVGEATLYVEHHHRRMGAGRALLDALAVAAVGGGRQKLVAKIFAANVASLALFEACGYRRVGTHLRHGELRGEWEDVAVVERLLAPD